MSDLRKRPRTEEPVECSIIIPVYNQCHYTRKCLESIRRRTTDVRYEVIAVDDGSSDDTAAFLKTLEPPFRAITNDQNLGFVRSVNRGASEAKGKYLLFLNNDTEPESPDPVLPPLRRWHSWLREMINACQSDPAVGIVGAKLLYPDGTIQHFGIEINRDLAPYHLHRGKPGDDPACSVVAETIGVTGACLLIEKSLFDKVGGFDTHYPMYFEDIDLCLKVRQLGYKVLVTPQAVVTHHETKSIDKSKAEEISERSFSIYLEKWTKTLLGNRLSLGVDVRTLQFGASAMRGIGHYVYHSLEALIESSPDIHITLYGDREGETTSEIRRLAAAHHPNCTFRNYHQFHPSCVDALWLTDPLTPIPKSRAGDRYTYKPMIPAELGSVKLIATAYDLIPLVFEDQYLKHDPEWEDEYKRRLAWLSRHVDHFLALSECTKNDYARYLELPKDKIAVVSGGIAEYFRKAPKQDLIAKVRSRMRFEGPVILYVGSLDPRKNPEGLLETVRKVSELYQGDFRLVIVGIAADEEVEKIRELAIRHNVQDKVIMTGYVQPDELNALQHISRVLLFPSLYEGFGLPVLEAMAAGLPVVCSNRSSLTEVAGEAAILCDPIDTDAMAKEVVRLLTNNQYHKRYSELGLERARHYSWARVAQRMRQAISAMLRGQSTPALSHNNLPPAMRGGTKGGADNLDSSDNRRDLVQKKLASDPIRLTYEAPMLDISGYACMARNLILGLDDMSVDVRAKSMWFSGMYDADIVKQGANASLDSIKLKLDTGETVEYRTQVDPETVRRVLKLTQKPAQTGPESIYVLHHIPAGMGYDNCLQGKRTNPDHGHYVCSTMFETHSIPGDWVDALTRMDEVWVPSHFNQETFGRGGVPEDRIHLLPLGIDPAKYDPETVGKYPIPGMRKCNFLSIFQWTKRKGWDVLLRAYLQAFHRDDDVSLVIRSYYGKSGRVDALIDQYVKHLGYDRDQIPPIIVIGHRVPDSQMPALYNSCTAFVLPSRGEGWGIPYMESMALGKPVIATNWSGNTEYMTKENSLLIDSEGLKEVDADQIRDCSIYAGQMLAEPNVDGCAQHVRFVYEHPDEAAKIGARARQDIIHNWTSKNQAARVAERCLEIRDRMRAARIHSSAQVPETNRAPAVKKSNLKILFLNRPDALTHPGGDTQLMNRLKAELESLNVRVYIGTEAQDVSRYDLAHLINLTILPASLQYAQNVLSQGKSYVITSLYEDWQRYLNLSYDVIHAFKKYIESGQDPAVFEKELQQAKQQPPSRPLDNDFVANNALCHFCCAETERNALTRRFPQIKRSEIVPFAPTLAATYGDGGTAFRKEFGVADFVLCVGRLESRKNQLMLLKALEHEDIPIVFATGGYTYQPLYENLCRKYRRNGKTLFLNRLPEELLASAYQAARLHVLPSWYELPGLVSLEAAAFGTGVVGSSWGALPNYLGDAAYYFQPDDPEEIRGVILEAWDNPRGDCARDAVKAYSWQESARKTLETYQECCDQRQSPKDIVPLSWREQAKLTALSGDVKSALMDFQAHWDSEKDDPIYLFQLGELSAKAGDIERAKEIMARLSDIEKHTEPDRKDQPVMSQHSVARRLSVNQPLRVSLYTLKSTEACFYVRLIAPLEELERQGKIVLDYPVRFEGNTILNPEIPDYTDVAIFQRSFVNMDPYRESIEKARGKGKVIIYEIDDLLINVPDWHPQRSMFDWGRPYIKRHISTADHVSVSTERLKSNLMEHNPYITVIPNTVDPRLWRDPRRQYNHTGPVVIGYTGTVTHMGDIRTIVPAIEEILRRYCDRVVFKFWGICPKELLGRSGILFEREYTADYPQYAADLSVCDFDLALVPLADCEFNQCKSPIKWLEYGIAGIPGIYQDSTPYRGVVRHRENGLLADDVASWVDALTSLIDDPTLRRSIASAARKEVMEHHTVLKGAACWENFLKSCLEEKAKEKPMIPAGVDSICSIIIPAYNLWHLTQACLDAIYNTVHCPCEVILVDNGSSDETPSGLQSMIAKQSAESDILLRTVRLPENLGFAAACNRGAKEARGKYLVFLNNDTCPQDGWLAALIEELESDPEVAVVGSKLLYPNRTVQHAGIVASKDKVPFLIYRGFDNGHEAVNKHRDFPAVSAACMIVSRDLFLKLNGFDEQYQNGFEDVDFCLKVATQTKHGDDPMPYRIRYCPQSVVTHFEESTPGRHDRDDQNLAYLLEKWGDRIQACDEKYLREDGLTIEWIFNSQGRYVTVTEKVEKLIRQAKELENQGSLAAALQSLDEIARLQPDRDDTYTWMARMYMALNQLEKAESCLEAAPKTARTSLAKAEVRIKCKKIKEAVTELEAMKKNIGELAPHDGALTCSLLGNCMVFENRLDEAEELFREALALDESSDRPHLSLGSVSLLRSQFDEAEMHFREALKRNPAQPKAHFGLGVAHWNRGYKEQSIEEYKAALDHDISHAQALYSLTAAAADLGRWELAAEYLERYIARNPNQLDFLCSLCGVYYRMGESQKAQELCDRILRLEPNHPEARELRTKILQSTAR